MKRAATILSGAIFALLLVAGGSAATAKAAAGVLPGAIEIDRAGKTATFPLFEGKTATGQATWYVVTESSNRADAARRGVNHAPKLANALGTKAVQRVTVAGGLVKFPGTVDFRPVHRVVAGPTGFPPSVATPGSAGDARYSPLISTNGRTVLNAEQIANNTGRHDKVVRINFRAKQVTLELTEGRQGGKKVLYLSTDASDTGAAALEASTFAPNLDAAPGVASDEADTSARTGLVAVVNGATGANNPQRQGLSSALLDGQDPLNILQWPATHPRYSPLWDVHPAVWTAAATSAGERARLASFSEVAGAVGDGQVVSGGDGPANERLNGLKAGGFVVNCPIIAEF
ncbi:hypothetical protein GBA63_05480 [Rubrobacter tropicus]|uniref:Uncharacterized protein n=1 Tax=Rubrobacter tropicus TaxID=2653851 RepID=A0A6G8Q6V5_9ACTN|nr:hypothetical protein [Rubrobacter tropicus]QIN82158.1 hypothetical protein GBA63_05480 [Rubrobacter tropicus]